MRTVPMIPEDEDFVFRLYASTRMDEMRAWGWDAAMQDSFLSMQWHAQRSSYAQQFPNHDQLIVLSGDARIGRVLLFSSELHMRLIDLAIMPDYQNQGFGTAIIRELQAEAAFSSKPLHLKVLTNNRALAWYRRLGFLSVGEEGLHTKMVWQRSI